MRISDLLRHKGSEVVTATPGLSVTGLLDDLARHNIGAVVVVDDAGALVGIVTERDVVRRLNDRGAQLLHAPVAEIMTTRVVTCERGDDVTAIAKIMTERRVRHMPVVADGSLVGLVSIGDVVRGRIEQLESQSEQLERYIVRGSS
ncbi:histidine kinase [Actinophytocola xinjiangensis]|uniref:Histidine kinase n=1 Tax=Actinophytocola xinjiangensis TaxID=485602 RepID=A0A7Z0WIK7_9PSEU|nr:CBS domain-containing protein [Actinophytocola xinjiangensis]OLF08140.1 histidine kinase [Actinophytocola xinjiangensis]